MLLLYISFYLWLVEILKMSWSWFLICCSYIFLMSCIIIIGATAVASGSWKGGPPKYHSLRRTPPKKLPLGPRGVTTPLIAAATHLKSWISWFFAINFQFDPVRPTSIKNRWPNMHYPMFLTRCTATNYDSSLILF